MDQSAVKTRLVATASSEENASTIVLVSVQLIPAPLPELGRGRFSFFPAILGVKHNEWILRRATWTEVLVVNTKTAEEMWIARSFLGDVSPVEAPVRIVGLVKQLEYKKGVVLPHCRGVIEMPRAVNGFHRPLIQKESGGRLAPVFAIRVEPHVESRLFRWLRSSAALGLILFFVWFAIRALVHPSAQGPVRQSSQGVPRR